MNTTAIWTHIGVTEESRAILRSGRRAAGDRRFRIVALLVLAVAFWFAVPYSFPIELATDPLKAAAGESAAFQGSLSRQIAMPVILFLSGVGLWHLPARAKVLRRSRVLFASSLYALWAFGSLLWSTDPETTRKRLIVFAINSFFCFVLARLASIQDLAWLGFLTTGSIALVALYADVFVLHSFAPANPDYRFMGVMTANYQAMNLFVCLVCGIVLLLFQSGRRWWLLPLLALFTGLLFLTRARIGFILFFMALLFVGWRWLGYRVSEERRALALVLAAAAFLPALFFLGCSQGTRALSSVFMMGRDDNENTASLSNRAPLWSELAESVRDRPVLGFGFDGFWTPARVEKISLDQGWVVPHAHNTYLDQTLALGFPGLALFTSALWGACGVSWMRFRQRGGGPAELLPAMLLCWLTLLSLTESMPVTPNLPILLAYSCAAKMFMQQNEEAEVESTVTAQASRDVLESSGQRSFA